jgi:hypothetical protein
MIRRLMQRVRRCARARRILICTDGLCSDVRATCEAFRDKVSTGSRGRQPLRVWGRVQHVQVVKCYDNRRVFKGEPRIVYGRAG